MRGISHDDDARKLPADIRTGMMAHRERIEAEYGPHGSATGAGPPRYLSAPTLSLHYLVLNTRRPLFSHLRLRQAAKSLYTSLTDTSRFVPQMTLKRIPNLGAMVGRQPA